MERINEVPENHKLEAIHRARAIALGENNSKQDRAKWWIERLSAQDKLAIFMTQKKGMVQLFDLHRPEYNTVEVELEYWRNRYNVSSVGEERSKMLE